MIQTPQFNAALASSLPLSPVSLISSAGGRQASSTTAKRAAAARAERARGEDEDQQLAFESMPVTKPTGGSALISADVTKGDINSNRIGGDTLARVCQQEARASLARKGGDELASREKGSRSGGQAEPQMDQQAGREGQRQRRHLSAGSGVAQDYPLLSDSALTTINNNNNNLPDSVSCKPAGSNKSTETASNKLSQLEESAEAGFKAELVWTNIILFVILHSCLPVGIHMLYTRALQWKSLLFVVFSVYASGLGVTGGSHRLWSHKAYKAKWPVQLLLMVLHTMAGQNSIYTWSRDHRVHHKFSETNADPHNINRGFFFAHMGWLCCRKHPDVREKGKLIDMSDLEANSVVMFQHRNFWWLSALFTVLVPTLIPVLLWNERLWPSFIFSFMVRYLLTLHGTWCVNSVAHYFGHRPYDGRIEAREAPFVISQGLGEGFHNYHHTFPYDYAAGEFGRYFNITTAFIDLCAALGLVSSRRLAERETIRKRRLRTGEREAPLEGALLEEAPEGSTAGGLRRRPSICCEDIEPAVSIR